MPRLNNKDYTVEELERLIYLASVLSVDMIAFFKAKNEVDPVSEEIKQLIEGSEFTNFGEGERKPEPIPWNFNFETMMMPTSKENADIIKNAMRSSEVMENIKRRFSQMIREEVNWYIDRVRYFLVKGDTNILE